MAVEVGLLLLSERELFLPKIDGEIGCCPIVGFMVMSLAIAAADIKRRRGKNRTVIVLIFCSIVFFRKFLA